MPKTAVSPENPTVVFKREFLRALARAEDIARDIIVSEAIGADPTVSRDECFVEFEQILRTEFPTVIPSDDDPDYLGSAEERSEIVEERATFIMGMAFGRVLAGLQLESAAR